MTYHPLTQDSGGTAEDRRNEADRILNILEAELNLDEISPNERKFLEDMLIYRDRPISTKQLFWLRDIKDRLV